MKKNGRTGKGTQRWRCRGLPAELDDAAARIADGRGRWRSSSHGCRGRRPQTASESTGDAHALRKRIAWCWSIRLRIAPPDAKRHTVMADGTYMKATAGA